MIGLVFHRLVTLLLVGGIVVIQAPGAHGSAGDPSFRQAAVGTADLLRRGRLAEAAAALAALRQVAPEEPALVVLLARLRYLQGRYESARQVLKKRFGAAVPPASRTLASRIEASYRLTRGFRRVEVAGGELVFVHPPGLEKLLLPYAERTLVRMRQVLRRELGLDFRGPVRVEILPGPAGLSEVSVLRPDEVERTGTIALCKDRRILLVTPRAVLTGYRWLDTLAHELTHFALEDFAPGNVPLWLHEGLARFAQERWRASAATRLTPLESHLLARALRRGSLIPLKRMTPSFAKLRDAQQAALAFAQVHALVRYLHQKSPNGGLRRLLYGLGAGRSVDEALREVTGSRLAGLLVRFRRHLRTLGLKEVRALRLPRRRYRDRRPPAAPGARRRALEGRYQRLGAILRARGRLAAAAVAYRRSLRQSRYTRGRVANTLARVLLRLGRIKEAREVCRKALPFSEELAALHVAAARAAERLRDDAGAVAQLRAANRVDPFDPEVHCSLTRLLKRRGDRAGAERERRACRLLR